MCKSICLFKTHVAQSVVKVIGTRSSAIKYGLKIVQNCFAMMRQVTQLLFRVQT